LTLQPSQLQPGPLLKVSGIYISLASMLEGEGRVVDAYKELLTALSLYGKNPTDLDPGAAVPGWARGEALSPLDRLRVIGLEQKLGQLALDISSRRSLPPYPLVPDPNGPTGWEEAAERHLSAAIKAMLKLGLAHRGGGASGGTGAADGTSSSKESHGQVVVGRDLALPDSTDESGDTGRVDKRGLGMTMEHLAEIYARKGQYDVAGQLLLQAVSTLLPPQSQQAPPVRDRCQGEWAVLFPRTVGLLAPVHNTMFPRRLLTYSNPNVMRRAAQTQLNLNSRYGKLRTCALRPSCSSAPRLAPSHPYPHPHLPKPSPALTRVLSVFHSLQLTSLSSS
jgi:tetratricopeptide (TPR) repeat protein